MQFLASRWALKEALVKASGSRSIYYPGVFLKKDSDNAKPKVVIEGETNTRILFEELEISKIHASISHEEAYATAYVLLETTKAVD